MTGLLGHLHPLQLLPEPLLLPLLSPPLPPLVNTICKNGLELLVHKKTILLVVVELFLPQHRVVPLEVVVDPRILLQIGRTLGRVFVGERSEVMSASLVLKQRLLWNFLDIVFEDRFERLLIRAHGNFKSRLLL
jgi:hypothetical protein